ncbi:hypothetical protein V6N00_12470 [Tersicoccus sp. MR15.9]|uniref:hypothetical protein n=1 Tax=Tersicoccus mangrovi TaxID=3121635 RepID=UPI002FE60EBF
MPASPTATTPAARAVCDCSADHQHGTRDMYGYHRCRCVPCASANLEYGRRATAHRRRREMADAVPVRARLHELRIAGFHMRTIAEVTGINAKVLDYVLTGRKGRLPLRVSAIHARAILAVGYRDFNAQTLTAGSKVSGDATAVRVQAMVAAGWTVRYLASEGGVSESTLFRILGGNGTTCDVERAVASLYARLRGKAPEANTIAEAQALIRSQVRAAKHGWTPGMAEDLPAAA